MINIKLNDRQLRRALKNIDKYSVEVQQNVANVVAETSLAIESGAKLRSPVDTGRLRSSIKATKKGEFTWSVGTNVEYALYVEFGTRRQMKQPYLVPAVESQRQRYLREMKKALNLKKSFIRRIFGL